MNANIYVVDGKRLNTKYHNKTINGRSVEKYSSNKRLESPIKNINNTGVNSIQLNTSTLFKKPSISSEFPRFILLHLWVIEWQIEKLVFPLSEFDNSRSLVNCFFLSKKPKEEVSTVCKKVRKTSPVALIPEFELWLCKMIFYNLLKFCEVNHIF